MKKIKKFICFICIGMFICGIFYLYNDGSLVYIIKKQITPPISLIEYYTGLDLPFETELKMIKFTKDWTGENLEAIIVVPTGELDNLFPENTRNYDVDSDMFIFNNIDIDDRKIYFSSNRYSVVRKWNLKWNLKMQRTMKFTVIKSNNGCSDIHISIDLLSWYLWNKWHLGWI